MFTCECGNKYKFASGLNKHKERCVSGSTILPVQLPVSHPPAVVTVNGGSDNHNHSDNDDPNDITKSSFFTTPLTNFKPTANFTKEDLEMLEKRKQARLKAIIQSQKDEKQRNAIAAAAAAASQKETVTANGMKYTLQHTTMTSGGGGGGGGGGAAAVAVNEINQENVGNEEHNASFHINYVRRSEQTQQVIDAVTAAANEYCKGHSIVTGSGARNEPPVNKEVTTSVNAAGTTVYNHPPRTISVIETTDDMDESEQIVTLEKMTYLVLALIQQNTKLQKENAIMKTVISKIDPSMLE
jgi:hypothetical protein